MSRVLVIYHGGACFDGFCAAWLFKQAFPVAEFHAAVHGQPAPDVAGKRVFIVDFSYKRPEMRRILSEALSVTVLDHHKTAEMELGRVDGLTLTDEFCLRPDLIQNPPGSELPRIWFDMNKSGGRLAWEFLYGNRLLPDWWETTSESGYSVGVAPWLVDYTEDRDLWRWVLPESRAINAALRSYPLDFAKWDAMHNTYRDDAHGRQPLAQEGHAILRAERQTIDNHVRNAREIDLGGYKILAVNATTLFSDIAGELANDRPFGACYFDRGDGFRVWSLRSRDGGVDVSEVAKAHGGGGHRNAAGFQVRLA